MSIKYTGELSENPCKSDCPRRSAECRVHCSEYNEWRSARNAKLEEEHRIKAIGDITTTQRAKSWCRVLKTKMADRSGRREHER